MTARTDIRDTARTLGWRLCSQAFEDTFIRADRMVSVWYQADGIVKDADRYQFFSVDNLKLTDRSHSTGKKSDVIGWLCE